MASTTVTVGATGRSSTIQRHPRSTRVSTVVAAMAAIQPGDTARAADHSAPASMPRKAQ